MKTCPICQSRAFDDAKVCYGCLHRFDDGLQFEPKHRSDPFGAPPTLLISLQAVQGGEGAMEWRCDVDGRTLAVAVPS